MIKIKNKNYNEHEIMNLMEDIEYGWVDKNDYKHINGDESFLNYILQSPEDVIKNKIGSCWDQVELERRYFENSGCNIKTYFIVHYDDSMCPSHTFLTFSKNNKYYWFEHSWKHYRGIFEYNSEKELLFDVRKKFIDNILDNKFDDNRLCLYEYEKPKYHISTMEFYKHCENCKEINIDNL